MRFATKVLCSLHDINVSGVGFESHLYLSLFVVLTSRLSNMCTASYQQHVFLPFVRLMVLCAAYRFLICYTERILGEFAFEAFPISAVLESDLFLARTQLAGLPLAFLVILIYRIGPFGFRDHRD